MAKGNTGYDLKVVVPQEKKMEKVGLLGFSKER